MNPAEQAELEALRAFPLTSVIKSLESRTDEIHPPDIDDLNNIAHAARLRIAREPGGAYSEWLRRSIEFQADIRARIATRSARQSQ